MARIILPRRPDPVRVQSARIAAARVQTASSQQAVNSSLATVEASVPADQTAAIADLQQRIEAREP